jgi:hypothetical protein
MSGARTQASASRNPYFGFNAFSTSPTPDTAGTGCAARFVNCMHNWAL